ncbi:MAG: IPTL-CTERM sorting domain-containing protein [Proteobacteria bacterium]|nr:IPTL-CTERM sorting domain-containing protein [Pseudomonadota bacterium]
MEAAASSLNKPGGVYRPPEEGHVEDVAQLTSQLAELRYALDTFYFLVMGALVMWMAAGFTMLESGLVRAKNTAEILTKNVGLYSIACIMYMLCGYSIMYPGDFTGGVFQSLLTLGSGLQGGAAPERTLRVRNIGTADLTTANLTIPVPFQIGEGLASLLTPGSSDTLTLVLPTATLGMFAGPAQFDNNDADENPFNFTLAGEVVAPPTPSPTPIPTLGEWGLIAMTLLLLMSGAVIITRKIRLAPL